MTPARTEGGVRPRPQWAPATAGPPAGPSRRLGGWRLWTARIALAVAAPAAVLGAAEGVLRLAGYGYPTRFYLPQRQRGSYVCNHAFGWRFFPRMMAREPGVSRFEARKAPRTVRIFVLGSSAAYGVPDPAYGFSRILEAMLRERHPAYEFEVLNTAMTAVNSHVARLVARECAAHQPDFYVVYMGNNEVVGPYGAGTVFGSQGGNLWAIRAGLWAKSTCLGQMLGRAAVALLPDARSEAQWEGMAMYQANLVAADDPRLEGVYGNLRANLTDIFRAGIGAGAQVLVCTVVTNLRDCPPLASVHRPGMTEDDLRRWQSLYEAGVAEETGGRCAEALAKYAAASVIDDRWADLAYRQGRCAWALGRFEEAREHFTRARDLDALRFRADTRINAVIRETASAMRDRGVLLVDAADRFASHPATPDGIVGREWLWEHVHLTFEGNCLLARLVMERLEPLLPGSPAEPAAAQDDLDFDHLADLVVLTPFDRYRMAKDMAAMTSRPPFTGQIDHATRQARLEQQVQALKVHASAEGLKQAEQAYVKALERRPTDPYLHGNLATVLEHMGRPAEAARHWRVLLNRFPGHVPTMTALGLALMKAGQLEEALAIYRQVLAIYPKKATVLKQHADVLLLMKRLEEAVEGYQEALRVKPDYADAHNNIANALMMLGRLDEAGDHSAEAVRLAPEAAALANLATIRFRQGRLAEALDLLRRAEAMGSDDPQMAASIRQRIQVLQSRLGTAQH